MILQIPKKIHILMKLKNINKKVYRKQNKTYGDEKKLSD